MKWFWRVVKRAGRRRVKRRRPASRASKKQYTEHKSAALALVTARLAHFNQVYGLTWKSVSIRNQKTRWGSCSRRGALHFNYRLVLLPPHLADYVIVHELCHLKEFNHSKKFWQEVERTLPDWRAARRELKKISLK